MIRPSRSARARTTSGPGRPPSGRSAKKPRPRGDWPPPPAPELEPWDEAARLTGLARAAFAAGQYGRAAFRLRQASSSQSTFGPPAATVAVARIVLLPAFRFTRTEAVDQVFYEPVVGKFSVTGAPPLTLMAIGRAAAVPLAYRMVTRALPAAVRFTVHCTKLPATLA